MWRDLNGEPLDARVERAREAWNETVAALPVGAPVGGVVINEQPFGVFVELDGHPAALGLIEIGTTLPGTVLPSLGARVVAVVIDHASHNHQVRMRLSDSAAAGSDPGE